MTTDEAPQLQLIDDGGELPNAEHRWVFLTNRQNLLQVLSSGLVAPAFAYEKYYEDLLRFAPAHVPLVSTPLGEELMDLVSPKDAPAQFPVAIEISSEWLQSASENILGGLEASGGEGLLFLDCLIPSTAITCVHFRSAAERDEHIARPYANVNHEAWDLRVTEGIFIEAEGAERERSLNSFLETNPAPSTDSARVNYLAADSFTGALIGLIAALPAQPEWFDALASGLMGKRLPKDCGLPPFALLKPGGGLEVKGFEELLLRAAVIEFAQAEASSWNAEEVLVAIRDRLEAAPLPEDDKVAAGRALTKMREVITLERDFEPFEQGRGSAAAKAILLALLRPEPTRLLRWDQQETGASEAVIACACALAGIAQGRTSLSIELRPPELDAAMSELAASVGLGGKPAVASAVARSDAGQIELEINGSLAFAPAGPTPLAELIGLLNPANAAVEALLNELVEAYGWHDARSIKIDLAKVSPIIIDDADGLSARISGYLSSHTEFDLKALADLVASTAISAEHAEKVRSISEP